MFPTVNSEHIYSIYIVVFSFFEPIFTKKEVPHLRDILKTNFAMIHTSEPSCLEEEVNRRKVIEHSPRWSCGFLFMHYLQILFEKYMSQWFLFLSVPPSRINCWFLISRVSIRNPKAGIDLSMTEAPIIIETCPLICTAKQRTDFYMIGASFMKDST